jgi:hypothetical protein
MQFRRFDVMKNWILAESVSQVRVVRSLFVLLGLVVFRSLVEMVGRLLVMTSGMMIMLPGL